MCVYVYDYSRRELGGCRQHSIASSAQRFATKRIEFALLDE